MKYKSLLDWCLGSCFTLLLMTMPVLCGNKADDTNDDDTNVGADKTQRGPAIRLPDSISFAGEPVPLDKWYVKELLDREILINAYEHGMMLYLVKLSNRYFPLIEERLRANNVPDDMKYLCVAESKLQNAVSRVGASGFWQFMRATAPSYGLRINNEVDERYHVLKSTDAACKYLKAAYEKFGSWTAAAASYNCGQGGYNGQANFQKTYDYYDLMLPEETNHYMFRILAFKHLLANAKQLGFEVEKDDMYWPHELRTVIVKNTIPNLVTYALDNGTNYKELKMLNPWLRSNRLTVGSNQNYELLLPKK